LQLIDFYQSIQRIVEGITGVVGLQGINIFCSNPITTGITRVGDGCLIAVEIIFIMGNLTFSTNTQL
jgi:hypothetical protein